MILPAELAVHRVAEMGIALPAADYVEIASAGHLMNIDDPISVTAAVFDAVSQTP